MTGSASTLVAGATPPDHSGPGATRTSAAQHGGRKSERTRTEPHVGHASSADTSHEAQEELQRQYAFYSRFNLPPARPRPRIIYVLTVFAIGAAVGLIGAWWWGAPTLAALENELPHSLQGPQLSDSRSVRSAIPKGIDPRELPYDGSPPDVSEQAAQLPPSRIDPEERPYAGIATGNSVTQARALPSVRKDRDDRRGAPGNGAQAKPASTAKKTVISKASQKRRSTHRRITKDQEIERIKQQAAEELKKKTENSRSLEPSAESSEHRSVRRHHAPTAADKSARTRAMLARCERAANFFLREKCKWRLCGDSWGMDGCPSYQTHANPYPY